VACEGVDTTDTSISKSVLLHDDDDFAAAEKLLVNIYVVLLENH
jgi:hypothetical protein